ncbi:MAG: hypothetical protein IKZ37_00805 [Bacteroidaceae bacterium]|nr:hypothetical protein [Bacteroidaceae bacterium]
MKKITIPKITPASKCSEELEKIFATLDSNAIDCCNWEASYPYTPKASFKLFHDCENLYIKFDVTEIDIHTLVTEDFGKIWTDPCVEFFVSPEGNMDYYNFECTCIGKMLLGWHPAGADKENASLGILGTIKRIPSLGCENFPLREGENSWTLIEIIPATALFRSGVDSWSGKKMRANFYKCGDNLPTPHFISWNAIDWPEPSFHRPEFFGELDFE